MGNSNLALSGYCSEEVTECHPRELNLWFANEARSVILVRWPARYGHRLHRVIFHQHKTIQSSVVYPLLDILRALTPALLTRYRIVPAISSEDPALFAGTLSNKAPKIFPSAPTGFMLLGTTFMGYSQDLIFMDMGFCSRTARIDPHHADVESVVFGCEQLDQVVSGSFARRITCQIHVGHIVHTCT